MRRSNTITPFLNPRPGPECSGFTLLEIVASLALLGMIGGGIAITFNRCIDATQELTWRYQALTVARENLEQTLTSLTLKESLEQGTNTLFPHIQWETLIETFSEPVSGSPWARVVCTASYEDEAGETQTLELEHWLTPVDELGDTGATEALADKEFDYTKALEYVSPVDEATFAQWIEWGLKQTADDKFIQHNLDIFIRANGAQPTEEELALQVDSVEELRRQEREREETLDETSVPDVDNEKDAAGGDTPIPVGEGTRP